MENQVILACIRTTSGFYFSKWIKGRRSIGDMNPYYALQEGYRPSKEVFGREGDIVLLFQPLIKWSED